MSFKIVRARKIINDMRILATTKQEMDNVKSEIMERIESFKESNKRLMKAVSDGQIKLMDWSLRYDCYQQAINYDQKVIVDIDGHVENIQKEIRQMEIALNEFSDEELKDGREQNTLEEEKQEENDEEESSGLLE